MTPLDVPALCREAAWEAHPHGDGTVAITLDVPHSFVQALATTDGDRVRLRVELCADVAALSDLCRQALERLLAQVRAAMRSVKPVWAGGRAGLEAWLDTTSDPDDLDAALTALSVACRLSVREAQLLSADEVVARAYLESVGPC